MKKYTIRIPYRQEWGGLVRNCVIRLRHSFNTVVHQRYLLKEYDPENIFSFKEN